MEIANNTVYGLSGAVFGEPDHALEVARMLRTGQVMLNGGQFNVLAPFGGYKRSGNGREFGRHGLEEFLETKSIQLWAMSASSLRSGAGRWDCRPQGCGTFVYAFADDASCQKTKRTS
ncbi:aldehyde dehydrogenase family protein [Streptomyces melanosporofaciens]|uniref:aldehyde dehydrogenase family protein n=1 Tax=Streptomyces melanosporofaciens TaxID=67327 RepID=UPI00244E6146|nr:aldehyde dehydrogenase family protein [Streptomyces melanosporofaciens]